MMSRASFGLLCCALAWGCAAKDETAPGAVTLDLQRGSAAGHFTLTADLSDLSVSPEEVSRVTLGGIAAYDLEADGDLLRFTVQGAEPGSVDLVLSHGKDYRFADAFTYDPPIDPLFDRMVAIGASLTQGVQGGVPTHHGNLHSPGAVIAQQSGAYFPLPLLVEGLFPALGPEDVGPPPDCVIPDVVGFVASAAVDVLLTFQNPETGQFDFGAGRVDPDLEPHNLAVGGARVAHVVHGTLKDDFGGQFMAHLVLGPDLAIDEPVTISQLERLEQLEPTLVISTDLFGNDIIGAVVNSQGIRLEEITPDDEFEVSLELLLDRLAATGAEVFLATLPQPTLLPMADEYAVIEVARARAAAEAAGEDPDAAAEAMAVDVAGRLEEVDASASRFNQILVEQAAAHDNIHVVDMAMHVDGLVHEGVEIGGKVFKVEKLGGLLSVDGIHFSDTGYALVANLFLSEISQALGVSVPEAALADVAETDPFSPSIMLEEGLDPGCVP